MCCGQWGEFIGSPKTFDELIVLQKISQYWHYGPALSGRNFAQDGEPESLWEISQFRCAQCARYYYIDQFT